MINYIWAAIMLISVGFSMVTGKTQEVSDALFSGGKSAVELCLILLSSMCIWGGLMKIADTAGLTKVLAKVFRPVLKLIFPGLDPNGAAARAICMNVSANMLGLGNAATPLGIEAMKQLKKLNPLSKTASNYMITFVVMNTASLQIIPATIGAMRQAAGSKSPMDIMPEIWVASFSALVVALILANVMNFKKRMSENISSDIHSNNFI